jgi:hypothetical protein
MKAEVFAAAKGFKKAMMEDRVKEEWAGNKNLTEEETAIEKPRRRCQAIPDLAVQRKCLLLPIKLHSVCIKP